jgi:hypothetical protein
MSGNTGSLLPDEQVTFLQHALPGLADGRYELTVAQRIMEADDKTPVSGNALSKTYHFGVVGDRFRLSRPDVIQALFPADHAAGEFDTALPHVVLRNPSLPWMRSPVRAEGLANHGEGDADVPTWLAILALDADDAAAHPGTSIVARAGTLRDLFAPADVFSYFGADQKPEDVLDPGETPDQAIQVLELPLALFWQVAPTLDELKLLAHVRRVGFAARASVPGVTDEGEPVGDFAVVFGNRLPAEGRITTAHLVSLEGLGDLLPVGPEGDPPAAQKEHGSTKLRLAVLRSWSFTATGTPATFTRTLLRLNGRSDPQARDAGELPPPVTTLQLPYHGANPQIRDGLAMGFVPMEHTLRDGGRTASWYRGPLAPYEVGAGRVKASLDSADEALIFDPTSGLFDASYAAAWTLGRMLSLQDKAFSAALYAWRHHLQQQVADAVENSILSRAFPHLLAPSPRAEDAGMPPAKRLMGSLLEAFQPEPRK